MDGTGTRLYLLETVFANRCQSAFADAFPYLQARATHLGAATRWGRLGYETDPAGDLWTPVLTAGDVDALRRDLADFRPTHVLVNQQSQAARVRTLLDDLGLLAPVLDLESIGTASPAGTAPFRWLLGRRPGSWGGQASEFPTDLLPDVRFHLLNDLAREASGIFRLVICDACGANARAADNPFLAGLDPRGFPAIGCSFCDAPRGGSGRSGRIPIRRAGEFAAHVLRTLDALDLPVDTLDIYHLHAFRFIDQFLAPVLAVPVRRTRTLAFSLRVDDLLASRAPFARILPSLLASGHRIRIERLGVESFSDDEMLRFNKGITAAQNIEAVRYLLGLRRAHPELVDEPHLSLIFFTPWTTMPDLHRNFEVLADLLGGVPLGPEIVGSLRLLPGSLIEAAAIRDGAVAPAGDDPGQDYATWMSNNALLHATPWRFRDRRVALCFRVLVRMVDAVNPRGRPGPACGFPRFFDATADADSERVRAFMAYVGRDPGLVPALLQAAESLDPEAPDAVPALLDAVRRRLTAAGPAAAPGPRTNGAARPSVDPGAVMYALKQYMVARRDAFARAPGLVVERLRVDGAGRTHVLLRGGDRRVALRVRMAAADETPCLFRAGPFVFDYPPEEADAVRAAAGLVQAFRQALDAPPSAGPA
jgi:hypothetical protein